LLLRQKKHTESLWNYVDKSFLNPKLNNLAQLSDMGPVPHCPGLSRPLKGLSRKTNPTEADGLYFFRNYIFPFLSKSVLVQNNIFFNPMKTIPSESGTFNFSQKICLPFLKRIQIPSEILIRLDFVMSKHMCTFAS